MPNLFLVHHYVSEGADVLYHQASLNRPTLHEFIFHGQLEAVMACLRTPLPIDFNVSGRCGRNVLHLVARVSPPDLAVAMLEAVLRRLESPAGRQFDYVDWRSVDREGNDFLSNAADCGVLAIFWFTIKDRVGYFKKKLEDHQREVKEVREREKEKEAAATTSTSTASPHTGNRKKLADAHQFFLHMGGHGKHLFTLTTGVHQADWDQLGQREQQYFGFSDDLVNIKRPSEYLERQQRTQVPRMVVSNTNNNNRNHHSSSSSSASPPPPPPLNDSALVPPETHLAALVKQCVEAGADVCYHSFWRRPILHHVIRYGMVDCVAMCLRATQRPIDFTVASSEEGNTALHWLCRVEDPQRAVAVLELVVERLRAHEFEDFIDWGKRDAAGHDFLSCAAAMGYLSIFWPILRAGVRCFRELDGQAYTTYTQPRWRLTCAPMWEDWVRLKQGWREQLQRLGASPWVWSKKARIDSPTRNGEEEGEGDDAHQPGRAACGTATRIDHQLEEEDGQLFFTLDGIRAADDAEQGRLGGSGDVPEDHLLHWGTLTLARLCHAQYHDAIPTTMSLYPQFTKNLQKDQRFPHYPLDCDMVLQCVQGREKRHGFGVGMANVLYQNSAMRAPLLHQLISRGAVEAVRSCLTTPRLLDWTRTDDKGQTPLHLLCRTAMHQATDILVAIAHRLAAHPGDRIDWEQRDHQGVDFLTMVVQQQLLAALWPILREVPHFACQVDPIALRAQPALWDWELLPEDERDRLSVPLAADPRAPFPHNEPYDNEAEADLFVNDDDVARRTRLHRQTVHCRDDKVARGRREFPSQPQRTAALGNFLSPFLDIRHVHADSVRFYRPPVLPAQDDDSFLSKLRELVCDRGGDVMYATYTMKRPVLHEFVFRGYARAVEICLETPHPIDFTRRGWFGRTALHHICDHPSFQASLDKRNKNNNNKDEEEEMLSSAPSPVISSATATSIAMLQRIVRRVDSPRHSLTDVVDWEQRDDHGHDFLTYAAVHGMLSTVWPIVKYLPDFAKRSSPIAIYTEVRSEDWAEVPEMDKERFVLRKGLLCGISAASASSPSLSGGNKNQEGDGSTGGGEGAVSGEISKGDKVVGRGAASSFPPSPPPPAASPAVLHYYYLEGGSSGGVFDNKGGEVCKVVEEEPGRQWSVAEAGIPRTSLRFYGKS